MQNSIKQILGRTKFILGTLLLSALLIAAGVLIFLGWLTEEMSEGDTLRFDNSVRAFAHQYSSPTLTVLMQIASFLGSTVFLTILSVGVFILFWWLKRHHAATLFAITMAGGSILLFTLKNTFQRVRPEPFFETVLPASYSFPSGHSLLSFCFYGVLAAIITRRIERRSTQIIIWIGAVSQIALVGFSRVYLGVHYPSDVLAGYAAAFVWVVAVAVTDRLLRHRNSDAKEREQNRRLGEL